jgi:predicted  nucleic acid-binding Zn-ribbon protein
MNKKILSFYEKIRKWAGNTAVVPVRKQACYGCYLKISDKSYSDVIKADEIITCPHCGRILYLESQVGEIKI